MSQKTEAAPATTKLWANQKLFEGMKRGWESAKVTRRLRPT